MQTFTMQSQSLTAGEITVYTNRVIEPAPVTPVSEIGTLAVDFNRSNPNINCNNAQGNLHYTYNGKKCVDWFTFSNYEGLTQVLNRDTGVAIELLAAALEEEGFDPATYVFHFTGLGYGVEVNATDFPR